MVSQITCTLLSACRAVVVWGTWKPLCTQSCPSICPSKSLPRPAAVLHSVLIQLLPLLPIMEVSKRVDTLGDSGWLTEEEEGKGADRCLKLSPGADEINPSSKADERWKQCLLLQLAALFPLCIQTSRAHFYLAEVSSISKPITVPTTLNTPGLSCHCENKEEYQFGKDCQSFADEIDKASIIYYQRFDYYWCDLVVVFVVKTLVI